MISTRFGVRPQALYWSCSAESQDFDVPAQACTCFNLRQQVSDVQVTIVRKLYFWSRTDQVYSSNWLVQAECSSVCDLVLLQSTHRYTRKLLQMSHMFKFVLLVLWPGLWTWCSFTVDLLLFSLKLSPVQIYYCLSHMPMPTLFQNTYI